MPSTADTISPASLRAWPLPKPSGGKGSRGRVVVAGGAGTTPGAAMLAGFGALRVGAGVLTLGVAESVAAAVGAAVPEAGVEWLPQNSAGSVRGRAAAEALSGSLERADALLVGPGLDDIDETVEFLTGLVELAGSELNFILDAYALGALTHLPEATLRALRGRLLVTPNRTEALLLVDGKDSGSDDSSQDEQIALVSEVAERYGAVVSSDNVIVSPEGGVWTVPAGHPGLGTSGSGDVLAGAVTGLVARTGDLAQAACWGTYLHAASGDRLAARIGALGFLARELAAELPLVLAELQA